MSYPISQLQPLSKLPITTPGNEVSESVPGYDVYLTIAGVRRPRILLRYGAVTKILSGNAVLRKVSTNAILQQFPVADGTFDGEWRSSFFTGLEPDTWYEVSIPQGFLYFTYYNEILGQNAAFSYKFRTYPLASITSWEVNSSPYSSDPLKIKVNRTTNLKLNFGRVINRGYNNELSQTTMTANTHPSTIGLQTTPPTTMRVELYKKQNDELVEVIDFSKTFGVDKVGVQYTAAFGSVTVNFTHSLDCGTEYYVLVYNPIYDLFWKTNTGSITDKTKISFKTDGVKFITSGHSNEIDTQTFDIQFDRVVVPGNGYLKITDITTGKIINELDPTDYCITYYNQNSSRGVPFPINRIS